jgi:predicted esterase
MGYLSRYFLRYFNEFNSEENYFIAPQAPSKYYVGPKFRHVGASWLTKENTKKETENIMRYIDGVLENEDISNNKNLIVLGYSQGVSIAMRYLAYSKLSVNRLIIHSGGIPAELDKESFKYGNNDLKVSLIYGTEDEFLSEERITNEIKHANLLFNTSLEIIPFIGKHEVNTKLLKQLIK